MHICHISSSCQPRRRLIRTWATLGGLSALAACGDATAPPKPVSVVLVNASALAGTVGQSLTPSPTIQITDAKGNPISGVAFTVTAGGGGTVAGTPARTTSTVTSIGTWTFGDTAGAQTLTIATNGVTPLTLTATAAPGFPSGSTSNGVPVTANGVVASVASIQPSIKVTDAFGNGIAGVAVTVQITGGGSVQNANPTTDATGVGTVGAWTLGSLTGTQTVILAAAGVPSVVFSVVTTPPGSITLAAGDGQTGSPSTTLPVNPVFRVLNVAGAPVAGQGIIFTVTSGGGTVTTTSAVTDAQGQASPGAWKLGAFAGSQTMVANANGVTRTLFATAMAPAGGTFSIDLRFVGGTPSQGVQAAFAAAVSRMSLVIVAKLEPFSVSPNPAPVNVNTYCRESGTTLPTSLNEVVPNVIIFAEIVPIDGMGGILGSSGPCALRPSSMLPVFGLMKFDSADINQMVNNGTVNSVVLHEMQHVLGFGTIWTDAAPIPTLVQAGSNPIYLGAAARAAYLAAGGTSAIGVPVEAGGGQGTALSHWRETVFQTELMTGFLTGASQPYSKISMAQFADLGYSVSYATAELYNVPAPGSLRADLFAGINEGSEVIIRPVYKFDKLGRAIPIVRADTGASVVPQAVRKQ
jgi:hypothetical protein